MSATIDSSIPSSLANEVQNSSSQLLSALLGAFNGTITASPGDIPGVYSASNVVYIGKQWLPGGSDPRPIPFLAVLVGHEIAHQVLPKASASYVGAPDHQTAILIGERNKTEAYVASYVVAW